MKRILSATLMMVLLLVVVGCGKPPHQLTPFNGKVTYNGIPLKFGCVTFQPETGHWSRGLIQPDGTFRMSTPEEGDGAAVGINTVRITCFENQDPAKQKSQGGEMGLVLGKSLIPQKYTSQETSGITVEVKASGNEPFVFDLKD